MKSTKISKNLKLTSFRFFVRLDVAAVIMGTSLRDLDVAAVIPGMNLADLRLAAVIAGMNLADSRLAAVKTGMNLRLDTVFMGTITVLIPIFY
ncbi:hypothetical protein OCH80_04945 [Lactobacillus sp. 23-2]|uniref:hypothetical protein n=1 Tax=Lactobacillus sp. 23-2 TaxID=2981842 RepID=UPI003832BEED